MKHIGVICFGFLVCVIMALCLPRAVLSGTTEVAGKAALQSKGYGFDQPSYTRAVTERDYEAVELFLKAGMPPATHDELDEFSAASPMAVSIYENDLQLFTLLRQYGDAPDMEVCAFAFGQATPVAYEAARACLDSSMDFTIYPYDISYNANDPQMKTLVEEGLKPVHWASALGKYYIIQMVDDADFMILGWLDLNDTGNLGITLMAPGAKSCRFLTTTRYFILGQQLIIPRGWDADHYGVPKDWNFYGRDYLGNRPIYTSPSAPDMRLVKKNEHESDWYSSSHTIKDLQFH